jgi:hypothetical protein
MKDERVLIVLLCQSYLEVAFLNLDRNNNHVLVIIILTINGLLRKIYCAYKRANYIMLAYCVFSSRKLTLPSPT